MSLFVRYFGSISRFESNLYSKLKPPQFRCFVRTIYSIRKRATSPSAFQGGNDAHFWVYAPPSGCTNLAGHTCKKAQKSAKKLERTYYSVDY